MHRGKCHADADLQQELDSHYSPTTYMYINFVCFHDETKKKKYKCFLFENGALYGGVGQWLH